MAENASWRAFRLTEDCSSPVEFSDNPDWYAYCMAEFRAAGSIEGAFFWPDPERNESATDGDGWAGFGPQVADIDWTGLDGALRALLATEREGSLRYLNILNWLGE